MASLREIRNALLDELRSQGMDPDDVLEAKDSFDLAVRRITLTVELEPIDIPAVPRRKGQKVHQI